jgi:hypothetical protein
VIRNDEGFIAIFANPPQLDMAAFLAVNLETEQRQNRHDISARELS